MQYLVPCGDDAAITGVEIMLYNLTVTNKEGDVVETINGITYDQAMDHAERIIDAGLRGELVSEDGSYCEDL